MENMMKYVILEKLKQTTNVLSAMIEDPGLVSKVEAVAKDCVSALKNGNKLLFMGNGGSAADSQHLAAEMVSRFAFDRPGLPAFALTVDTSVLTAIGNDYGYEHLFSRQIEAVAKQGDVLFGISTSGRSPNILAGLVTARNMGLVTVGMTGNHKARIAEVVDHCIEIPSNSTPNIQEGHIVIGHIICGLIEEQLFTRAL
jgi:D-sedoheptulose 7-phosphate isomerase